MPTREQILRAIEAAFDAGVADFRPGNDALNDWQLADKLRRIGIGWVDHAESPFSAISSAYLVGREFANPNIPQ